MRFPCLLLLLFPLWLTAQTEQFNDFRAEATLDRDGSLRVTETIEATAAGDQIERGIVRVLRRRSIGDDVQRGRIDYEVISVQRNGAEEPWKTKKKNGFTSIYLGDKDVLLSPGTYTYELAYSSSPQLYFSGGAAELRWAVFSTDLRLPVRQAELNIDLPAGTPVSSTACYTGPPGSSRQQDCEVVQTGNRITFRLKSPLAAGEGFSVGIAFPAGYFTPPPPPTPLEQNGTFWICLAGIFAALIYGYNSWRNYGVDPPTPRVGFVFSPPRDLSPASVGYLRQLYPTGSELTASLTVLAIKGYLKIEEEERSSFLSKKDIFIIRPQEKAGAGELPAEQAVLYEHLLAAGEIELDGEYDKRLQKAAKAHLNSLKEQHDAFKEQGANGWKVLPFALILLVTLILALFFIKTSVTSGIITFIVAMILLVVGTPLYAWLIRQPSPDKVKLLAEIKSLREYLDLPQKKHATLPGAPPVTRERFEALLPYAIALGIETDWAAALAHDLGGTLSDRGGRTGNLAPFMAVGFAGRMNTAYSSTSQPASSGGSGGFSGGGGGVSGGGGGSGGW